MKSQKIQELHASQRSSVIINPLSDRCPEPSNLLEEGSTDHSQTLTFNKHRITQKQYPYLQYNNNRQLQLRHIQNITMAPGVACDVQRSLRR